MIPTKPPPTLKDPNKFSNEFSDFISRCLVKNPEERPSATALLQHKFIKSAKNVSVLKDLVQYAQKIVEEEEEDSGSDVGSFQCPMIQPMSALHLIFVFCPNRRRRTMSFIQPIRQWSSKVMPGREERKG